MSTLDVICEMRWAVNMTELSSIYVRAMEAAVDDHTIDIARITRVFQARRAQMLIRV